MMARLRGTGGLVVLLWMGLWSAPVATGQSGSGTITGSVRLAAVKTAPLAVSPYGRRGVPPKRSTSPPDIRNVIVYITGRTPSSPPPPMRARLAQRDEQFVPRVTAVTTGSSVEFPNEDPFFHNVFSLSRAAQFDLRRYPSGSSRTEIFTKAGIVKVFCHLHAQMTALIMVLDHPWFVIPSDDGTFTLPGVPPGELSVVAWHERIGERREVVRVIAGETTSLSFTLPVLEPTP
jgi:hypothetical protein